MEQQEKLAPKTTIRSDTKQPMKQLREKKEDGHP